MWFHARKVSDNSWRILTRLLSMFESFQRGLFGIFNGYSGQKDTSFTAKNINFFCVDVMLHIEDET